MKLSNYHWDSFFRWKPEGKRFLAVVLGHTIIHTLTSIHVVLLPIFMDQFNLNPLQASLIITVPTIAALVSHLLGGLLTDKLGYKIILVLSFLVEGVSAIVLALTTNIYLLVIFLSLISSSITLYHPPSLSLLSETPSIKLRGKAFGLYSAGGPLGIALGPISLGLLMTYMGWRFVYLLWAIPALLIASLFYVIGFERPEYQMNSKKLIQDKQPNEKKINPKVASILTTNLIFLLLIMGFRGIGVLSSSTFITLYFVEEKGMIFSTASIIYGAGSLAGIAGGILGGFLISRLGEKKCLSVAYTASLASILFVSLAPSLWFLAFFYFLFGLFNIAALPSTHSLVARLSLRERRGLAYGVIGIPFMLVSIIFPLVIAIIIEAYGIWYMFPLAMIGFSFCVLFTRYITL